MLSRLYELRKGGYFKDDRTFLAFFDPLPPPYCVQTVHSDRTFGAFFDPSPPPHCVRP